MGHPRPALPGPLRPSPSFPFAGRQDEMRRLRRTWALVDEGRRVVLVGGEPGAGKTRLVRELAHLVADQQGLVLYGACDAVPGGAFQPVLEAVQHLLRHAAPGDLAADLGPGGGELIRLFPDLPHRVSGLSRPPPASAQTERHRLHSALVELLANTSLRRPVLFILDDLHWADHATLLLLRHLLRTRADARLLVVGTFRDAEGDVGEPLADLLAHLARVDGVERFRLDGLEIAAVADFVDGAGGLSSEGDGTLVVAGLQELTGGNAFLLVELWRQLVDTGVLTRDRDGWAVTGSVRDVATPDGVRQIARQRLSQLARDTQELLRVAAIAGPEVSLALLRATSDVDEATLLQALEDAVRTGMLEPAAGPRPGYRFTHELLRRAVRDGLNPVARGRLHLRVAEALERRPDDDVRVLGELAAHYTAAAAASLGPIDKAVAYCRRAAEVAMHRLAFDEAASLLVTALELGVAAPDRVAVHLRLGAARRAEGHWWAAIDSYRTAAALARSNGEPVLGAEAALGLEETCWRPGITTAGAADLLQQAVELIPATASTSRLRVRLLAALTRAYGYQGRWQQAHAAYVGAVQLARSLSDPESLARALGQAYWGRGADTADRVVDTLAEAHQLAQRTGDLELACYVRAMWMPALSETGDFRRLRRELDELGEVAERLGQHIYVYHHRQATAALALADGRLAAAAEAATQALELSRIEGYDAAAAYGIQMFGVRREQDRLGELAPALRLLTAQPASGQAWRPGLAALCAAMGRPDEARRQLHAACVDGLPATTGALGLASLAYLADTCAALADAEHARAVYAALHPWQGRPIVVSGLVACYGAADRYLGMLATCLGAWADADRHFRTATDLDRAWGLTTWLARGRFEHARMLLARRRPGDAERAEVLLEQARLAGERHQLTALCRQIADVAVPQAPPRTSASPPDGLTARELDVLRLLAQGQSNREIGLTLFISQNTAANHVRSILMKTGCANRTEAASFAHRRGLVEPAADQRG